VIPSLSLNLLIPFQVLYTLAFKHGELLRTSVMGFEMPMPKAHHCTSGLTYVMHNDMVYSRLWVRSVSDQPGDPKSEPSNPYTYPARNPDKPLPIYQSLRAIHRLVATFDRYDIAMWQVGLYLTSYPVFTDCLGYCDCRPREG